LSVIKGRAVGIRGTGMCLPKRLVTNSDLEKIVDTSDEWIVGRSGIKTRYIVSGDESNSSMAASAGLEALRNARSSPGEVDMIIVGTNSPDTLLPGVGPTIQHMLGADRAGGMDIQAGCPGGLFAMAAAAGGIASEIWENVLVIGSEAISRLVDWEHRSTCVLFGDGAGAAVMGEWREGMPRLTHIDLKADGEKKDLISIPGGMAAEPATEKTLRERRHFLKMNGTEVFKFVNRKIPPYLANFCSSCGITPQEADWWIFHQANIRILQGVLSRMEIPMERAVINLDRYGNTSAASIMIGLHEAVMDGRIKPGQKVIITSFGAGMTYGAALVET
jgi:3-oxoacyl-[acyl-carrier-protein] synthase-3